MHTAHLASGRCLQRRDGARRRCGAARAAAAAGQPYRATAASHRPARTLRRCGGGGSRRRACGGAAGRGASRRSAGSAERRHASLSPRTAHDRGSGRARCGAGGTAWGAVRSGVKQLSYDTRCTAKRSGEARPATAAALLARLLAPCRPPAQPASSICFAACACAARERLRRLLHGRFGRMHPPGAAPGASPARVKLKWKRLLRDAFAAAARDDDAVKLKRLRKRCLTAVEARYQAKGLPPPDRRVAGSDARHDVLSPLCRALRCADCAFASPSSPQV